MLLQKHPDEDDGSESSRFPYKSHVIHVISSMAKNDGFDVCRQYFEIGPGIEGLTIPQIRQWQGPVNGKGIYQYFIVLSSTVLAKFDGDEQNRIC